MKKIKLLIPTITIAALTPMVSIVSCGNKEPQPIPEYDGPLDIEVDDETQTAYIYGLDPTKEFTPDLVIPEKIRSNGKEYTVTEIGYQAFAETDLQSVSLPNSIVDIDYGAFANCKKLTKINMPTTMKYIPESMLGGCSALTEFYIPESVVEIGLGAFANCTSMARMVVDKNNPVYTSCIDGIEKNCIIDKSNQEMVYGWSNTIPEGIKNIGPMSFYGTSIKQLSIPSSVETIEYMAFSNCDKLESITFSNASSLKTIGTRAFEFCSELTSFHAPASLESISYYAFDSCKNLNSVTFNSGLKTINDCAFIHCSSLEAISIPASVEKIGAAPFAFCPKIDTITVDQNNKKYISYFGSTEHYCIMDKAENGPTTIIQGCNGTINVSSINTITTIEELAFAECNFETFILPANLTRIGVGAFADCRQLKEITFCDPLLIIDSEAFYRCSRLERIHITKNVISVSPSAFNMCNNLGSIEVDEQNNTYTSRDKDGNECNCIIGLSDEKYIQQGCINSTIPDDIVRISDEAFFGFDEILMIELPESIKKIGERAFANCEHILAVTYKGSYEEWKQIDFGDNWHQGIYADLVYCYKDEQLFPIDPE